MKDQTIIFVFSRQIVMSAQRPGILLSDLIQIRAAANKKGTEKINNLKKVIKTVIFFYFFQLLNYEQTQR